MLDSMSVRIALVVAAILFIIWMVHFLYTEIAPKEVKLYIKKQYGGSPSIAVASEIFFNAIGTIRTTDEWGDTTLLYFYVDKPELLINPAYRTIQSIFDQLLKLKYTPESIEIRNPGEILLIDSNFNIQKYKQIPGATPFHV